MIMMMRFLASVVIVLVIAFSFLGKSKAGVPYDYLQYVQQSPRAFCNANPRLCDQRKTYLPFHFTTHGIWLENYTINSPVTCIGTSFNQTEMTGQGQALNVIMSTFSWPSFDSKVSHMDFWRNEYNKHGMCSDHVFPQKRYSELAYRLWTYYNAEKIFCRAQIIPRYQYPYLVLLNAIRQVLNGFTPILRCARAGAVEVLLEIVICFDASGKRLVHCVKPTTCSTADLYYIL